MDGSAVDYRPAVPLAPVMRPTSEQFEDPLNFIRTAKNIYGHFGIVKVVPPETWRRPQTFSATSDMRFKPRMQVLHELNASCRVQAMFERRLADFLKLQGVSLKIPVIDGGELKLYKLFREVTVRGGYDGCTVSGCWSRVCSALGYQATYADRLKAHYEQILLPYECYAKRNGKDEMCNTESKNLEPTKAKRRRRTLAGKEIAQIMCAMCGSGDDDPTILLCDRCNHGTHMRCLDPPLAQVPDGDWHCADCTDTIMARELPPPFGFVNSKREYSLVSFKRMADMHKQGVLKTITSTHVDQELERRFWNMVNDEKNGQSVLYGSDLSTLTYPYGFPKRNSVGLTSAEKAFSESLWNLKYLPSLPGSALSYVDEQVSGVNVPWLYVGMCFSAFCWHTEDHWCYSISYLHTGNAKTWYGVPGDKAELFESVVKRMAPELFQWQPDLLHHLVTLVDPVVLLQNNVPVYKIQQEPGEFVITFPRSYHAGFNNGFNFAEAVNVCPADWIPYGRKCVASYASIGRLCVFAHDELICKMASEVDKLPPLLMEEVAKDLQYAVGLEEQLRSALGALRAQEMVRFEKIADDDRQCSVCATTIFLSCLKCGCEAQNMVCLLDARKLPCACTFDDCVLCYRYTVDEMQKLIFKMQISLEEMND